MAILNDLLVNGISRLVGNVTVTGALVVATDPTANYQVATKQYVDTNGVKLTVAALTSGTTYYPILATGTGTATRQIDSSNSGFKYVKTDGTTGVEGTAILSLGNTVASGTAGNVSGRIALYDYYGAAATIQPRAGVGHANSVIMNLPNWGSGSAEYLIASTSSSAVGGTTQSVYVDASGHVQAGSTYAGGTAVTLNGTSKAASTASFYAPTGAGTSGYVLKSNGSGAPSWAAESDSKLAVAEVTGASSDYKVIFGTGIAAATRAFSKDLQFHNGISGGATPYSTLTIGLGGPGQLTLITPVAAKASQNTNLRAVSNGTTSSTTNIYLPTNVSALETDYYLISTTQRGTAIGGSTQSVYIDTNGLVIAGSTYAGGTAVTLNGTSKAASTASFYAPTGAGTSGQYLKSNGSGAPSWTNFPTIPEIPSNNVTGSGITGYLAKWSGESGTVSYTLTAGPLIGTGTTKFLREDGTWQVPSGGSADGPFYVAGTNSIACVTTSPYYSSRWKGTNNQITSLYTGLTINFKIDVAGNGSYGTVLNLNDLGEHPVCANVNTYISTRYAVGCIIPLIYDADQTATAYINSASVSTITGVWKIADYDSTNTYYFLQGYTQLVVNANAGNVYRNQILLSKPDLSVIPVNNVNNGPGTYNKTLTSQSFDPFGPIYYFNYTGTGSYTPGNVTPSWYAYRVIPGDIRYSFNINSGGTAGTTALTASRPVYIKALYNDSTKQATLAPITSSTNYLELSSLTQSLPSTNPNSSLSAGQRYIYIYLGHAYDKYRVDFAMQHQVYTWNPASGAMQEFTGALMSGSGTFSMTHTVSNTTTTDTWNYYKQGRTVTVWGTFTGTPGASLDLAGGLPFKPAFTTKQTVCIHNSAAELIHFCAVGLTANSATFGCFGYSGSSTDEWGTWLGLLKNSGQTITFSYITNE